MIAWVGLALAGPVEATVAVAAPPAAVLALLADHAAALRLCPDVLTVAVGPADQPGCAALDVSTSGLLRPMRYRSERCLRPDGSEERLVASDDFAENRFTWTVTPEGTGSRVRLSVVSAPKLPVPAWILGPAVQRSVDQTVRNLAAAIGTRRP